MAISAAKEFAMTIERVYLAGIGAVLLSAIPKLRDIMTALAGQPVRCRFDEARWLVEECDFEL